MATEIYSDINQVDPHLTTPLRVDAQAIYQSIQNILNTVQGERLFNPLFGNLTDQILFKLISPDNELLLFREVVEAIERSEDRVRLDKGQSDVVADITRQRYDVKLVFEILGLEPQIFTFTGTLDRRSPI